MRIRVWVVLGVLVMTAGCQSAPDNDDRSVAVSNSTCTAVAARRAEDAAFNGFSQSMQRAIFDEAYKSCATR